MTTMYMNRIMPILCGEKDVFQTIFPFGEPKVIFFKKNNNSFLFY